MLPITIAMGITMKDHLNNCLNIDTCSIPNLRNRKESILKRGASKLLIFFIYKFPISPQEVINQSVDAISFLGRFHRKASFPVLKDKLNFNNSKK